MSKTTITKETLIAAGFVHRDIIAKDSSTGEGIKLGEEYAIVIAGKQDEELDGLGDLALICGPIPATNEIGFYLCMPDGAIVRLSFASAKEAADWSKYVHGWEPVY